MKTITIVFTKSKKKFPLVSKLIMWWTGKPYSHVARKGKLAFMDKAHYYHAAEGNVHYAYEDFFLKKNKIVKSYDIEVNDELYMDLVKASWKESGNYYGFLQNVGILAVDIMNMLGFKVQNPLKKYVNCSELMYTTIFSKMLTDLPYEKNTIKPHHIEEIIINNNLAKNNKK